VIKKLELIFYVIVLEPSRLPSWLPLPAIISFTVGADFRVGLWVIPNFAHGDSSISTSSIHLITRWVCLTVKLLRLSALSLNILEIPCFVEIAFSLLFRSGESWYALKLNIELSLDLSFVIVNKLVEGIKALIQFSWALDLILWTFTFKFDKPLLLWAIYKNI